MLLSISWKRLVPLLDTKRELILSLEMFGLLMSKVIWMPIEG